MTKHASSSGKCIFKDISCNGVRFSALIDTGCDLCLIRDDVVELLGNIELVNEKRSLVGICNRELNTLGSFVTQVAVDNAYLDVNFHVASRNDIKYSAAIGNSILKQVDLIFSKKSVKFQAKENHNSQESVTTEKSVEPELNIFQEYPQVCLFAESEEPEIDVAHLERSIAKTVRALTNNYKPEKRKDSPIQMKILLNDEYPVYEHPRRISHADKSIVDNQVTKWLSEMIIQPSSSEYASPVVLVPKKDGNFAFKAKPLSDLLRKDIPFRFAEEQLAALEQLKIALISAPVLRLYNPKAQTEIHTRRYTMHGYGGVLLQKDPDDQQLHHIQYLSRRTKPAEEKYHSYELEVLAIVEALKKWRVYLLGIKFKIITDSYAFIHLRVSRWPLFLQDYDYVIEHRSGSKMRNVDALSRVSCLMLEDTLHHKLQ
nr:uncharacterized protein LOC123002399 [Drosophila takahashii]